MLSPALQHVAPALVRSFSRRYLGGWLFGDPRPSVMAVGAPCAQRWAAALTRSALHSTEIRACEGNARLRDIPRGQRLILLLDEPLKRFAEGFALRRAASADGAPPWTQEERRAFARFSSAEQLARALSDRAPELRRAAVRAMCAIGYVREPYWHWLESPSYLLSREDDIAYIGYCPSMVRDQAWLTSRYSLAPVHLPTAVSSGQPFDAEALANLQRWYAADLRFVEAVARIRRRRGWAEG